MAFMTLESIVFKIKKKTNFKFAFNLFCLFVTYVTRINCRSHMTLWLTREGANLQYVSFFKQFVMNSLASTRVTPQKIKLFFCLFIFEILFVDTSHILKFYRS